MRDQGLFGPESVAWRVIGHPESLVGGMRALIIQSLHPLAMAGVAQHSDYRNRALDRLRRTAYYVTATTFGDTETAYAAAARVKRIHRRVRGTDPVTGQPYSADDPATQLWVHCVEWHSFLAVYRAYGGRLTPDEQDRYVAEGVVAAGLLDVPAETVPASVAEMRAYFEDVRPQLCVSASAREAIRFVMHPPMTRELLPLQVPLRIVAGAALATVPRHLRAMAGIDRPGALDAITVAAVRPAAAALSLPLLRDAPSLVLGRETRAVALAARDAALDREAA
ncbi:MAG TPA: oxygenase MpaB family protein [Solirubrobacteraceae bacterium]|nr:oxygenase MpaB family protein [Solirubrobacteraceae bacterium]